MDGYIERITYTLNAGWYIVHYNENSSDFIEIKHYDDHGNLISHKSTDFESYYKYDDKHRQIWHKIIWYDTGEINEITHETGLYIRPTKIKMLKK